jgi:hypothetical protein
MICARHADIGVDKVPTLKQQRLVHRFRQCASETIAERIRALFLAQNGVRIE